MTTTYESDIVVWANQQAQHIRAGRFDQLDLVNLAEEIEDVGKSEKRELASRMAVLLAHLLKWKFQANFRGSSWAATITEQRKQVAYHLKEVPSLVQKLDDAEWVEMVWGRAKTQASAETGIGFDKFPDACPWPINQVRDTSWLPE